MEGVAGVGDLDLITAMDGEPRSLAAIGRGLHHVHRLLRNLTRGIAIKRRTGLANLIKNSVGQPDVDSRIRLRILRAKNDANLAVPKSFLPINQQSEPPRIALGAQCTIVDCESAPADVNPVGIDFPVGNQRKLPP